MPKIKSPRKGSLQFWPRKRATKLLPSVNWKAIKSGHSKNLLGFIGYKAGMATAMVKDNTADSMTKGKQIAVPVTIIECPSMKIFSVRFYKYSKVAKEILSENLDKELKRKVKLPKIKKPMDLNAEHFDDVRIIVYSVVKKTGIKKSPDLIELGLVGNLESKLKWIKENIHKEISISDIFEKGQLADVRGVTKGKGFQGPIKRFGAHLRFHKSEKGIRKIGSIGPWHPAKVTFRVPMAGQMGLHTRVAYNKKVVGIGKAEDIGTKIIKNYGKINTNYILLKGSVQGVPKRPILLTHALRETRKTKKKSYDFLALK